MRASLVIVLMVALLSGDAAAECALGGYSAWPPPGPVPRNTVILVEVYGYLGRPLGSAWPATAELRGGGDVVPLEPQLRFTGQAGGSQVLLEPTRPLTPGVEYELFMPELEDGPLTHITFERPEFVPYRWTAHEATDRTAPVSVGEPKVAERRYIEWGCGSEIEVDVRLTARDSGPLLALAELTPTGGTLEEAGAYLLPVVDGAVSIGHGMCGGAFDLKPGGEYLLRLAILDSAGNRADPWPTPLRFQAKSAPEVPTSF